jgi:hypothetical protein
MEYNALLELSVIMRVLLHLNIVFILLLASIRMMLLNQLLTLQAKCVMLDITVRLEQQQELLLIAIMEVSAELGITVLKVLLLRFLAHLVMHAP